MFILSYSDGGEGVELFTLLYVYDLLWRQDKILLGA
jgi:hypothetical protein